MKDEKRSWQLGDADYLLYVIVCVFLCTHCTYVTYCNPYVWSGVWADNLPTCAWNRQTPRATTPSPRSSAEHDLLIYDALAPI